MANASGRSDFEDELRRECKHCNPHRPCVCFSMISPAEFTLDFTNPWICSCAIVVSGIILHLLAKVIVFPILTKAAEKTENDLDDRLIFFVKRFFAVAL